MLITSLLRITYENRNVTLTKTLTNTSLLRNIFSVFTRFEAL